MNEHSETVAQPNSTATEPPSAQPRSAGRGRKLAPATVLEKKREKKEEKPLNSELVRLNVNLAQESAEILKRMTQAKGISYTDAVRRALAVTDMIDKQLGGGRIIQSEDQNGKVRELIFL